MVCRAASRPPFAFLLACLLFLAAPVQRATGQELDCEVSVNYSQLTGSDFTFLQELQERVEEYMNDQAWTEDRFQEIERIDCTMQITFQEALSLTSFSARLVVATRRPIYGTTQSSTVVQFNDAEWQFNYARGTPLIFDPERFNALTSVLDFYAYVILGYDYDTFNQFGGTPYFEKARRIAQRGEGEGAPGWTQFGGDRGRVNLITQLLDPRFRPLRKSYFDYHFEGLDHFVLQPDQSRESVLGVLTTLETLQEDVSRQFSIDLFFSAKYQELAALFTDSQSSTQAYDLLTRLDPSHLTEYNQLVQ